MVIINRMIATTVNHVLLQEPMMPLWLLGWARRSSKPLWKRRARSRSGVSSVNCNEKTTMVEILLIYPSLELYHNKGIGQKLFWRFSTETLWEEMISLAKSVFLFRTLMFMRSQRLGNCCILFNLRMYMNICVVGGTLCCASQGRTRQTTGESWRWR